MASIDKATWTLVSPLLDRALDLPAEERHALVASLRAMQPALARVLDDLLASHERALATAFLDDAPLVPEANMVGSDVGPYTLERLLGRGGMGSVWLARRADGRFAGRAAVKLLNLAVLDGEGERRFQKEGTALARLSHPNIGRLLDAGVTPFGQPYLVLEYVDGTPITGFADQQCLDVPARLRLFVQVADAVAHAHANLVVHRDLKPSNVLVDAAGQVRLLDFGIAKLLADDDISDGVTGATQTAFTPAFAAPEQLTQGAVTVATDVFALGTLLYLLLTGRHPAEPALDSPAELMQAITQAEPPLMSARAIDADVRLTGDPAAAARARGTTPARLRAQLAGDLDVIAATALKRRPEARYASVSALATDVRRHLLQQPIEARADSAWYRTRTFVRRRRVPLAAGAVAVTALAAGAAGVWLQGQRAAVDRDFAMQQLARAEAMNEMSSFLLSDAAPEGRPFTAGDLLQRAEALLNRQPVDPPDAALVEALVTLGTEFQAQDEDGNARRVLQRAFGLAGRLPDSHVSTRARAGCALANSLARGDGSDLQRAQELVATSTGLVPTSPPFALDRVYCERMAASIAGLAGNGPAAVVHAETAHRVLVESGLGSPAALLGAEIELAEAYRATGQPALADTLYDTAFTRMKALGRDRTEQAGTLLNNWGLVLGSLGRPRDADTAFTSAVALSQADASGASVSPMLMLNAARPVLDLGRTAEATAMIERAIAAAKAADDQVVQMQGLMLLCNAYRKLGALDRAARIADDVEAQLRQRLPPGHGALTAMALQHADIAIARGRFDDAEALIETALARAQADVTQRDLVAGIYSRRAQIALAARQGDRAVADARRALDAEAERTPPGARSSRLGRMYLTLAEAQLLAGSRAEARATLQRAVEHLDATVGGVHADAVKARELLASTATP